MEAKKAKAMVKRINGREGEGVASVYEGYSGRGMYGSQTTGVVLPPLCVPKNWKGSRDSLGFDVILY